MIIRGEFVVADLRRRGESVRRKTRRTKGPIIGIACANQHGDTVPVSVYSDATFGTFQFKVSK
jgi:hypothetical protein